MQFLNFHRSIPLTPPTLPHQMQRGDGTFSHAFLTNNCFWGLEFWPEYIYLISKLNADLPAADKNSFKNVYVLALSWPLWSLINFDK